METTNEKEISLIFLFDVFKKGIVWILSVAVILAALAGGYTALFMKDSYSATFGFWISNTASGAGYTSSTLTTAATQIATDCTSLVKAKRTVKQVVTEGSLADYFDCTDAEAAKIVTSMISASKPSDDSLIFYVTISGYSREDVLVVSKAMQESVPTIVADVNNFKDSGSFVQPISPVETISDVRVYSPSLVKNTLMAFIAGIVATYVVIFIMTMVNTTVHDETTVKENFENIPVLGSIPYWTSAKDTKNGTRKKTVKARRIDGSDLENRNYAERLINEETPFAIAEAFNTLCTGVTYSVAAEKCPVFVVSGEIPGVGKSLVSANLALALANHGKKVLLVECDMRRPSFNRVFGKNVKVGLSEFLSGKVADTAQIINTYEGLDIIHAGHISPNPSELLSSERMKQLMDGWKESYDMVILDTPPICNVVDARVIAKHVNGYIFVVRSRYSDVREVKQAVGHLEELGAKIIGFVVNDKNLKSAGEYYNKYKYYDAAESTLADE